MSSAAASHENVNLRAELDLWKAAGRTADIWLRDDDAICPSDALDRLIDRLSAHRAPCLLAVVPMLAKSELRLHVGAQSLFRVAMHGIRHVNHGLAGGKKAETPLERGLDIILAEWTEARRRLVDLFGEPAGAWYVPPWNRIEAVVAGKLAEVGFRAVSTFADDNLHLPASIVQRNTHVDLMDWKGGRVGRPAADVLADLAAALSKARGDNWRPVGVLLHHLVHDAAAWSALDAVLAIISTHPASRWRHPDDLLSG